jgi:hypothetical protein
MDVTVRHPAVEGGCGLALTCVGYISNHAASWLDGFVSFGVDYITPLASEIAALGGALFTLHGAYRWVRRKLSVNESRRKEDRTSTPTDTPKGL